MLRRIQDFFFFTVKIFVKGEKGNNPNEAIKKKERIINKKSRLRKGRNGRNKVKHQEKKKKRKSL